MIEENIRWENILDNIKSNNKPYTCIIFNDSKEAYDFFRIVDEDFNDLNEKLFPYAKNGSDFLDNILDMGDISTGWLCEKHMDSNGKVGISFDFSASYCRQDYYLKYPETYCAINVNNIVFPDGGSVFAERTEKLKSVREWLLKKE